MTTCTAPSTRGEAENMGARQVAIAMAALLGGLFTAMLSSTIVTTALPTIIGEIHGSQRQYTWIITSYLLASTMSTPIWGKLSDLFSKRLLIQLALWVFILGSVAAGATSDANLLIVCRAVQGVGMGGITALTSALMGVMLAPRARSRYLGYSGALMALSIVSAPLIGGVIVDSSLGWRWTFYVCVPLALASILTLNRVLRLATVRRHVRIDYLGAILISVTTALPMLLVTLGGHDFPWWSLPALGFAAASVVALVLTVVVELRAPEPIIPLRLLRSPSTIMIIVASIAVGLSLWAGTTFLTVFFQIGRGKSATQAGILMIPLTIGVLCASTASAELITRTGRWKGVIVAGATCLLGGLGWLGTTSHTTATWQVCAGMTFLGLGVGAMMQNLVLAVQNTVSLRDMGAVSGAVAFFRSLGGAVGVAVLGAGLATSVSRQVAEDLPAGSTTGSGVNLDLGSLPAPVVAVIRDAHADAAGHVFLLAAGVALVAFVAVLFVREVPLRTKVVIDPPHETVARPPV